MVPPSKLSRRTRNFGYRLGLRRRLEKEDVVCFLLFVVGSFLIFVFYVVCVSRVHPLADRRAP